MNIPFWRRDDYGLSNLAGADDPIPFQAARLPRKPEYCGADND